MKRVVITGMGVVSPIGNSLNDFFINLKNGESGVGALTRIDAGFHATKYAAQVEDIEHHPYLESRERRRMDRYSSYTLAAAREAVKNARLSSYDPQRVGVVIGVGVGGFESIESSYYAYIPEEARQLERNIKEPIKIPPMSVPKLIINIAPANVAMALNLQGPCYSLATACASGTDAISNAYRHIQSGMADAIITGGVEAAITHVGMAGFNALHALSVKFTDNPKAASRPFDKDRDGFVMGEGAGVLVVEDLEYALKRKAPILAEIAGTGITCDAYHQTAPHPEGRGAIRAMKMALDSANLQPEDVDYINAHGTSTPVNDPVETKAIKTVFGEHAHKLKVSSTKSMTGHCIGAAGGLEAITCVLSIQHQYFFPTINLEEPDKDCDLDYVPNKGVPGKVETTLSNTFGFGGHNSTILLKKYI